MSCCAPNSPGSPLTMSDAPFTFSPARQPVSERHGDIELPRNSTRSSPADRREVRDKIETYPTRTERKRRLDDGTIVEGHLPVRHRLPSG